MSSATFQFHAELNDFLPNGRRAAAFEYRFEGSPSAKDAIEAIGVPHTEVDVILVQGRAAGFAYLLQPGDRVEVYPPGAPNEAEPGAHLQSLPSSEAAFVLDAHLGKLAAYLRMLGFDTLYRNDYGDDELAAISSRTGRILLSRDLGLLKRSIVTAGHYVRATNPRHQLVEVLQRYGLFTAIRPFRRCLRCNGELEAVAKDEVLDRLPAEARQYYHEFHRCAACGQIYWPGSHYRRMRRFIDGLRPSDSPESPRS
jgi:hypothetical protein